MPKILRADNDTPFSPTLATLQITVTACSVVIASLSELLSSSLKLLINPCQSFLLRLSNNASLIEIINLSEQNLREHLERE
jgi:hypothetical protein